MFYIEVVGSGPLCDLATQKQFFWDSGGEAQAESKLLNEKAKAEGVLARYRVKKDTSNIPRDPYWRNREEVRFDEGIYKRIPWARSKILHHPDHYVHLSLDQPGYVAYMPSIERGEQDRPERVSAGRYLNKYFGSVLTQHQIHEYVNKVFAFNKKLEILFATTPDDIEYVYANGTHTCVPAKQARAYGAGDLAVAYIIDDGCIVARSICWPEKKRFGRIYPEDRSCYWMELKQQLEAKGWRYYKPDEFGLYFGARLLTKKHVVLNRDSIENLYYTCPHLDHAYYVQPQGEYLIICEDQGLNARNTGNGVARGFKCDGCDKYGCASYGRSRAHGGVDAIPGGYFVSDKRFCAECLKKKRTPVRKRRIG